MTCVNFPHSFRPPANSPDYYQIRNSKSEIRNSVLCPLSSDLRLLTSDLSFPHALPVLSLSKDALCLRPMPLTTALVVSIPPMLFHMLHGIGSLAEGISRWHESSPLPDLGKSEMFFHLASLFPALQRPSAPGSRAFGEGSRPHLRLPMLFS